MKDRYNRITWFAVEDERNRASDHEGISLKYIGE